MTSRTSRFSVLASRVPLLAAGLALFACGGGGGRGRPGRPPTPAEAPAAPLSDSALAAADWVRAHEQRFNIADTMPSSADAQIIRGIAGDARIVGVSELTEGTHEFPSIIRQMLFTLAADGVRGVAIQGPGPEAMMVDRYVRTGVGDPKRLLHELGSWRWETREMIALVQAMRAWDVSHGSDQQLGFYGFEIPSGALAVHVATTLPDGVMGASLNAWLKRQYVCVAQDEEAHWGAEGRAADRGYWQACQGQVDAALDSIVARRQRGGLSTRDAADLAFAEQMARLLQDYVMTGLKRLPRERTVAEHTMYLLNSLGAGARLLVWGGDIEAGRLVEQGRTTQMGIPLGETLGEKYRAVAFAFGTGAVRARRPSSGGRGGQSGLGGIDVERPERGSYESVFVHADTANDFWLDARELPSDKGGAWLHGPRPIRLITEVYAPQVPSLFSTPIELPKNYDAVVYVAKVTPAR